LENTRAKIRKPNINRVKNWLIIGVLILLAFFLSACSQQTDLYLRTNQNWELQTRISINFGVLPEIRPEFEGFSLGIDMGEFSAAGFETTMRLVAEYCESRGFEASVKTGRSKGEKVYRLTVKGQGWDQLNSLARLDPQLLNQAGYGQLGSQAWSYGWTITDQGNDQVEFTMQTLEDPFGIGMLFPTTFRLHGKNIIRSNGMQTGRGAVTWQNPSGQLFAVLTPGSAINLKPVIILLVVCIFIGLVVSLIRRSGRRRCSSCGRRIPRGQDSCPGCGMMA
jgi:hypothetical protein